MKILKTNLSLYCLLAILALSVSFSSCSKEELTETPAIEEPTRVVKESFILRTPAGMSEEEGEVWAKNLSYDEVKSQSIERSDENHSRALWCHPWSRLQYIGKTVECNIGCSTYRPHEHAYRYVRYRLCYRDGYTVHQYEYHTDWYCRSYC